MKNVFSCIAAVMLGMLIGMLTAIYLTIQFCDEVRQENKNMAAWIEKYQNSYCPVCGNRLKDHEDILEDKE